MDKLQNGATIWSRDTILSEVFYYKPDKWFKIWFYIVNKVNHKDTKLFKRGTNLITYKEIQEATKASKNQIDKFIRWAKLDEMVETRKTTRGMLVTVCNYETYQDLQNYKRDKEFRDQSICSRNGDDTINKYDNNVNKQIIYKADAIWRSVYLKNPGEVEREFTEKLITHFDTDAKRILKDLKRNGFHKIQTMEDNLDWKTGKIKPKNIKVIM